MNINCLTDIIKENLIIHLDVSNEESWDLNNDFTITSLSEWEKAKSDNLILPDFGLTAYDNGRVNTTNSILDLSPHDTKLSLYRVGANDSSGTTSYSGLTISGITTGDTGNYFQLNGGYLQGFFKIENENFQLMPHRFNNGVSFETIIKIDNNSKGIFLYLGARAEDKYNTYFSGETTLTIEDGVTGFTGLQTSKGNYLNAFIDEERTKKAFIDFSDMNDIVPVEQPKTNTYDNVISFEILSDRRISIKRIDENGLISKISSTEKVPTGWTIIDIIYKPYTLINDYDITNCYPHRYGDLEVYANAKKIWSIEGYREFYFRGFKNHKEKQIGVPYNISWGGGSFGLKHSWHYSGNTSTLVQDDTKSNRLIEQNFNNSYTGGIQKLRVYDKVLSTKEILHNAYIELKNQPNYGYKLTTGGRIINI